MILDVDGTLVDSELFAHARAWVEAFAVARDSRLQARRKSAEGERGLIFAPSRCMPIPFDCRRDTSLLSLLAPFIRR